MSDITQRYFGAFSDFDDMLRSFSVSQAEAGITDDNVLAAAYGGYSYEGDAFVLYRRDGQLYEVNGGHCSCYGLEDQWEPELADLAELQRRKHFVDDEPEANDAIRAIVAALAAEVV